MVQRGRALQEMVMLECRQGSPVEIHILMVGATVAPMRLRMGGSQAEMEEEVMVEAAEGINAERS